MENNMENDRRLKGLGFLGLGYILGLCNDNGKENGNYYLRFRVWGLGFRFWGFAFRV